jgi:hypothetical protein
MDVSRITPLCVCENTFVGAGTDGGVTGERDAERGRRNAD